LDEHVPGKELLLGLALLLVADLDHLLGRHQDTRDLFRHAENLRARLDGLLHLVLEARVGVDDEPLPARRRRRRLTAHRRILSTTRASTMSTAPRKKATTTVTTITTTVELISSCRLGQVTLRNSAMTSPKNSFARLKNSIVVRSCSPMSGRGGGIRTTIPRIWSPVLSPVT